MATKPPCFDEMLNEDGTPRAAYAAYHNWYAGQDVTHLKQKARDAEEFFRRTGITFAVYGDDDAEERLIPFDIIPRIVTARQWAKVSRGIEQRVRAINALSVPGSAFA